jgi:hypothetical protein
MKSKSTSISKQVKYLTTKTKKNGKENTSIELAVALMLKGMAYIVHISLYVPSFIVSLIGVTFVKELTLDEAVSSIVYRFHSNWRIYILLC